MLKKIVHLLFEGMHLKQVKHEWVRLAGVQFPDSVAEHSCNAAQIGFVLAHIEWADPHKVASMLIWHDLAETRIGDFHKVGARYIPNKKEIEKQVMKDQLEWISCGWAIQSLFDEYEERETLEGKVAKDADYLEMAFQAKIYVEQGHVVAQDRIDNVVRALKTQGAKQLREEMVVSDSSDWWKKTGLKKM